MAIPQEFSAAWKQGDGQALGRLMADGVDFVTVGGTWLMGVRLFSLSSAVVRWPLPEFDHFPPADTYPASQARIGVCAVDLEDQRRSQR